MAIQPYGAVFLFLASLANQAPDLHRDDIRADLRHDAFDLLLGTTLTVLGLLAVAVFIARKRPAQRGLLWFGGFVSLYGVRLLFSTNIFQFTAEPIPRRVWIYLAAASLT